MVWPEKGKCISVDLLNSCSSLRLHLFIACSFDHQHLLRHVCTYVKRQVLFGTGMYAK